MTGVTIVTTWLKDGWCYHGYRPFKGCNALPWLQPVKRVTDFCSYTFHVLQIKSVVNCEGALLCVARTGRAVRCVLERGEDMLITGARHPVLGKYKVPGTLILYWEHARYQGL